MEGRLVIIESPFAGEIERNKAYLEACIRDCALRGESAYASHKMLTTALDDTIPAERDLGINLGFAWHRHAAASCVYVDHGISRGMWRGIQHAWSIGLGVEVRSIYAATDIGNAEVQMTARFQEWAAP